MKETRIMLVAGEVSGDMHAARMVREMLKLRPDARFFGIGGPELRACGMETVHDVGEMAVMGLTEVVLRYRFFRGAFDRMLELARSRKPALAILVDYPGFNLRLAKALRGMGVKVVYYICPQVWAWNRGRIPAMARVVNRLITIFPFEPEVFKGTGLRADFAGHPLAEEAMKTWTAPEAALPWAGPMRLALLPGSRRHEVQRILPRMWRAAALIDRRCEGSSFIIAAANEAVAGMARDMIPRLGPGPRRCATVCGQTRQVLRQARAAMVASGTATMESMFMRCPMIIVYRVSWLTYIPGRLLIRIPHIGMVNVVAGRGICPEFIQHRARPEAMAEAVMKIAGDGFEREAMLKGLGEVEARMGGPGAAERAARMAIEELG